MSSQGKFPYRWSRETTSQMFQVCLRRYCDHYHRDPCPSTVAVCFCLILNPDSGYEVQQNLERCSARSLVLLHSGHFLRTKQSPEMDRLPASSGAPLSPDLCRSLHLRL